VHEHDVHREPVEPRRETSIAAKVPDALVHLQEDLLNEIFEVVRSTGHPVHEARDVVAVPLEQLPERVGVAALAPRYELRDVVHAGDFSRRALRTPGGTQAASPYHDRGP
jgi:hypothetical protein